MNFKTLALSTSLALSTIFGGMAPAEAGTYQEIIMGDTVSVTYVGETAHGTHIVTDYDSVRIEYGQPGTHRWEVSCEGVGYQRWLGDDTTPAWDEFVKISTTQSGRLFYNTSCVWQ